MSDSVSRVNVVNGITIFKHMHIFKQCWMIVFLSHKINPKVFCPNFGVHFNTGSPLRVCGIIYYVLLCAHFVRSVLLSYFILGEHTGSPLRVCGIIYYVLLCAHFVRSVLLSYFILGEHIGSPLRRMCPLEYFVRTN